MGGVWLAEEDDCVRGKLNGTNVVTESIKCKDDVFVVFVKFLVHYEPILLY